MSRLDPHAPLNARQQTIRDAIRGFHGTNKRLPSRRELARTLDRKDGGYLDRVVAKLRTRGELPR